MHLKLLCIFPIYYMHLFCMILRIKHDYYATSMNWLILLIDRQCAFFVVYELNF
jgi:hypothetical protein